MVCNIWTKRNEKESLRSYYQFFEFCGETDADRKFERQIINIHKSLAREANETLIAYRLDFRKSKASKLETSASTTSKSASSDSEPNVAVLRISKTLQRQARAEKVLHEDVRPKRRGFF
jgi:hypothetical protein